MALLETRVSLLLVVLSYCFQVGLSKNLASLIQHRFSPDRMGPFYMTTKSISFCTPSGRVDKEHYFTSTIHAIKISRLEEEYRGIGIVPLDTKIQKVVWVISILDGGVVIPVHSVENRNPCSSILFATLAGSFIKLDSNNCVIKQGNYTVKGLNINTLSHIFTGDNFIHETFRSELEFFSSKGSIFCANTIFESKSFKRLTKPKKIN